MSLHRSRSIGRSTPTRAHTLPTNYLQSPPSSTSSIIQPSSYHNTTNELDSYLPSIDESLQDWLTRNVPETTNSPSLFYSLLEDPCPCCNKPNCEHLEGLYKNIRKLEVDARLAAEIGQSLLNKHEALITETNQTKDVLEKQVNECHEKIVALEQLLIDTDNSKLEIMEQRDQSIRKWQKAEQVLEDTTVELEKSNERCLELGKELKNKTKEVEKLRVFKMMARQADYREDLLRSQLEDTNQELAVSRKNELMLESKYKKLKTRYELVSNSYEKLKLNDNTVGQNTNHQMNVLKDSNEKLRNDITKLTSIVSKESNDQQSEQVYMVTLIKELAFANTKLRMELVNKENNDLFDINDTIKQESDILLSDDGYVSKTILDSYNMFHLNDGAKPDNNSRIHSCNNTLIGDIGDDHQHVDDIDEDDDDNHNNKNSNSLISSIFQQKLKDSLIFNNHQDELAPLQSCQQQKYTSSLTPIPSPSASTPSPSSPSSSSKPDVVHYHFHYHSKNKKRQLARKSDYAKSLKTKTTSNQDNTTSLSKSVTIASAKDNDDDDNNLIFTATCKDCEGTPYHKLELSVSQYLDRLKSTDICSLNRRLRRTFDMMELSNMSNSIIENILTDIKTIQDHFSWVKDKYTTTTDHNEDKKVEEENSNNKNNDDDEDQQQQLSKMVSAFFPILNLFQFMLTEIGELRMAMNHLQVDYVKKVEEMDIFVKEDILRKQNEDMKQFNNNNNVSIVNSKNKNNNNTHNSNNNNNNTVSITSLTSERNGGSTNNKSAFSWLSNVFHIQTQDAQQQASSSPTPSTSETKKQQPQRFKVRYQRSCDSISIASKYQSNHLDSDNSNQHPIILGGGKFPMMTTSCSLRVQQKRNEMDKFGPPSSFPRAISIHNSHSTTSNHLNNHEKKLRRRSTSIQTKSLINPLKPSKSTGPKASAISIGSNNNNNINSGNSIQHHNISMNNNNLNNNNNGWPPITSSSSLTEEVAIQRKRSLLGLGATSDSIDKVNNVDWKLGTSYGSSWLGSNF